MTADRFEVDTDQLRSAAARLAEIGARLGAPRPTPTSDTSTADADGTAASAIVESVVGAGGPSVPRGTRPDPAELLDDAGVEGWSFGSALARLHADWDACVAGLAADYSDHADQLRAAADRYDDAERIIDHALRGGTP